MNSYVMHNILYKRDNNFNREHYLQFKILRTMRVKTKFCNFVSTLCKINKKELLKLSFPAEKCLMSWLDCIQGGSKGLWEFP